MQLKIDKNTLILLMLAGIGTACLFNFSKRKNSPDKDQIETISQTTQEPAITPISIEETIVKEEPVEVEIPVYQLTQDKKIIVSGHLEHHIYIPALEKLAYALQKYPNSKKALFEAINLSDDEFSELRLQTTDQDILELLDMIYACQIGQEELTANKKTLPCYKYTPIKNSDDKPKLLNVTDLQRLAKIIKDNSTLGPVLIQIFNLSPKALKELNNTTSDKNIKIVTKEIHKFKN